MTANFHIFGFIVIVFCFMHCTVFIIYKVIGSEKDSS